MADDTPRKLLAPRSADADLAPEVLAEAEIRYNLDTGRLHVGDGETPGGIAMSSGDEVQTLIDTQVTPVLDQLDGLEDLQGQVADEAAARATADAALADTISGLTAADITETAGQKIMTSSERTKLAGVEPGAGSNTIADEQNPRFGSFGVPVIKNAGGKTLVAVNPRTGDMHSVGGLQKYTAKRFRESLFASEEGLSMDASTAPARFGSYGTPLAVDEDGVVVVSALANGRVHAPLGFDPKTLRVLRDQLDLVGSGVGSLVGDIPGFNHRTSLIAGHVTATMMTPFGPVDADVPISGSGNALALSNGPVEVTSVSGQSETYAGSADPDDDGDVTTGGDDADFGQVLRGWRDPHRCFRGNILRYSTSGSTGIAPSYTASGGMSSILPAGFDAEVYGFYTFTPDLLQFSIVAMDQYFQRPQTVYLQQTSAQGGTDLTEYMPGQVKGNNIAGADGLGGYVYGAQTFMQGNYSRDVIMRCHCLLGHEAGPVNGDGVTHLTYAELLSAFADYVCDAGEGLDANVAAGVRPIVITYQPNQSRGAVDFKTYSSGGTLGTLTCAISDPDVFSIGGVYDEKTADGGIHRRAKLMMAEKMAYVRDAWVHRGIKIITPYIDEENSVIDGPTITLPIITNLPGPMMEDTDWMPSIPLGGIHYDDDTHSAEITSIKINNVMPAVIGGSDINIELILHMSTTPTGANPRIYVAGRNNNTHEEWSGGLCSFYVPGIPSFWHRMGFSKWCTPEIRWRLAPQIVAPSYA